MAKDRAQNNEIKELLSDAVEAALLVDDEQNSSRSHTQTSEAQLKRISILIQATAEDHEFLVKQQMNKEPLSVSSTSSLSSLEDDEEAPDTGLQANLENGSGSSRSPVEEEDGDDKDKNHFDPESLSKIGGVAQNDECPNDIAVSGQGKESSLHEAHCLQVASLNAEEAGVDKIAL